MLDGRVHLLVFVYWSDSLQNRFSDAFLWSRHVVFPSEIHISFFCYTFCGFLSFFCTCASL